MAILRIAPRPTAVPRLRWAVPGPPRGTLRAPLVEPTSLRSGSPWRGWRAWPGCA